MGRITLKQAAAWCGGTVAPQFEEVTFLGACNDTRKLQPGQLFVALAGVRDGHDFINAAMEQGAAAVLCKYAPADVPAIVVEDPRLALGAIAAGERQRIGMQVIGVTGSVGKSTTKEMIATVLERTFTVAKTPANHNNDIGMPMAILSMPEDTQVAVLEMGMNHFREIAYLSNIAKPDMAVIINVGTMHMENLGSREGILQAKLEILEGMEDTAPLFVNADNDLLDAWSRSHGASRFGTGEDCPVRAESVTEENGCIRYTVCARGQRFPITLHLEGLHYVCDSLAAVSVGLLMGLMPQLIAKRLAAFRNMEGRQEIFSAKDCTIIKDCYNAGPESMAAALAVLGRREGRRIAVLGDMLELGEHSLPAHRQVGMLAAQQADVLLSYGSFAEEMVQSARQAGISQAEAFVDRKCMADRLKEICCPDDVLLFKGSHGMHMELVLEQFLQEER